MHGRCSEQSSTSLVPANLHRNIYWAQVLSLCHLEQVFARNYYIEKWYRRWQRSPVLQETWCFPRSRSHGMTPVIDTSQCGKANKKWGYLIAFGEGEMRPSSAEYSKSIKPTKLCQNIKISWSGCQQHHFYCGTQKKYWFICCLNTTVQNDAAASSLFQGNRKLSPNHVWTRVISSERSQRRTEHWSASSEWKRSVDQKLGSIKTSNIYTKLIVSNWFCILAQRKKTQTNRENLLKEKEFYTFGHV